MGWTKRQFIQSAYDEIGMGDYAFDLSPGELDSALRRLDSMMAEWDGRGIRIGYPMAGTPGSSDIDADTTVPDTANAAIYTNLAIRIAAPFGKQPMPSTVATAKKTLSTLTTICVDIPEMQFPAQLPRGAGQKPWRGGGYGNPFFPEPSDPVLAGEDGELDYD